MPRVFDTLQLKQQIELVVLNAPASFEAELARRKGITVRRSVNNVKEIEFALAVVMSPAELESAAKGITARVRGDAVVWFADPKGTSKRYTSTIKRDAGFGSLGAAGFGGVRMVAIDEDWSAVRFRRAEFIRRMERDPKQAMSAVGRKKTTRR
jgi:hypothetical protein